MHVIGIEVILLTLHFHGRSVHVLHSQGDVDW